MTPLSETPVGIITAPRSETYISETVESLIEAGVSEISIFAEPESARPSRDTRWFQNEIRLGNFHNWINCAKQMAQVAESRKLNQVLITEDDIDISPMAEQWLRSRAFTGLLSLYTSGRYVKHKLRPEGIHQLNTCLYGACALLWEVSALRRILATKTVEVWGDQQRWPGKLPDCVDLGIYAACAQSRTPMFICLPSLVEHRGETSSLGRKEWIEGRRALAWSGHGSKLAKDLAQRWEEILSLDQKLQERVMLRRKVNRQINPKVHSDPSGNFDGRPRQRSGASEPQNQNIGKRLDAIEDPAPIQNQPESEPIEFLSEPRPFGRPLRGR